MKTLVRSWSLRFVAASLMMTAAIPAMAQEDEGVFRLSDQNSAGVVRISDQSQPQLTYRGQDDVATAESQFSIEHVDHSCPDNSACRNGYAEPYAPGPYLCADSKLAQWLSFNMYLCKLRQERACAVLQASCKEDIREKAAFVRCKFGYFCPSGADGAGAPPYGRYSMVYPVNPSHFDGRDGQVYAAPGYGGPVSVPIAPVVNHTYNYGWGIPSSRLTPIAHPLTPGVPVP